jgi:hypothetical protein
MWDYLFVLIVGLVLGLALRWGFSVLPREEWVVLGSRPTAKTIDGGWVGQNYNYMGVFAGGSVAAALLVLFLLLGAIRIPSGFSAGIVVSAMPLCILASMKLARFLEKKSYAFSTEAAYFAGAFAFPGASLLIGRLVGMETKCELPLLPLLAALTVSYGYGESIGRLGCISEGCCWGKPLSASGPLTRRLVGSRSFVFSGDTKQIAYERGLNGHELVPIQAVTSVICLIAALSGTLLYLKSFYMAALVVSLSLTQGWRALSEFWRDDHRGNGRISPYQIMAVLMIPYVIALALVSPCDRLPVADLRAGLSSLWDPLVILCVQLFGLVVCFFMGRNRVTRSTIRFHLAQGSAFDINAYRKPHDVSRTVSNR